MERSKIRGRLTLLAPIPKIRFAGAGYSVHKVVPWVMLNSVVTRRLFYIAPRERGIQMRTHSRR